LAWAKLAGKKVTWVGASSGSSVCKGRIHSKDEEIKKFKRGIQDDEVISLIWKIIKASRPDVYEEGIGTASPSASPS